MNQTRVCAACFSGLMEKVGESTEGGPVAKCNRCGSIAVLDKPEKRVPDVGFIEETHEGE